MGRYPMGHIYTAAILPLETAKALSYHPRPRSDKLGRDARQVKQSYFSLSGQNGRRVTKAHKLQKLIHRSPGLQAELSMETRGSEQAGKDLGGRVSSPPLLRLLMHLLAICVNPVALLAVYIP